ncbi:MAG: hypothetical protein WC389_14270 [Lutibacter sp.]|jgi:hypothetical protein
MIVYFGLKDWWLNTFTSQEQDYIIGRFQPLGMGGTNDLMAENISGTSQTAVGFLQNLSDWFNNKQDRDIAIKILEKAEELSELCIENTTENLTEEEADNIIAKHFLYHQIIKTYYPERNSKPNALEKAIEACQKQIALAPLVAKAFRKKWNGEPLPSHTGYNQLAIILKKQHKLQESEVLSEEAEKAGWR